MARPRRLESFSYVGLARYSLTFCTNQRRRAFVDAVVVNAVLQQFRSVAGREGFALLAYCFMPDHAHLLVEGYRDSSNLRKFAKMAKQRSGAGYAASAHQRLWQEGYHEHVLRDDEDARTIARYIVNNPVAAGLVTDGTAYPHLGSDVWSLEELFASLVR